MTPQKNLAFFDGNAFLGLPMVRPLSPVFSTDEDKQRILSTNARRLLAGKADDVGE